MKRDDRGSRPQAAGGRRPPRRGRPDAGEGRGTPRWLVPVLLVAVLALAGSAAWRHWGPARDPGAGFSDQGRGPAAARESPAREPPAPLYRPRRGAPPVRVEVLNGSGEPGAAAKLASYLREGGFNVVHVGSAERYDYLRTLVVARTRDRGPSRAVADYLGDVTVVLQRARSDADVSVIVGRDRGRLPWGEGPAPNGRG